MQSLPGFSGFGRKFRFLIVMGFSQGTFVWHPSNAVPQHTHVKKLVHSRIRSTMPWCADPSVQTPLTVTIMSPGMRNGGVIEWRRASAVSCVTWVGICKRGSLWRKWDEEWAHLLSGRHARPGCPAERMR